MRQRVGAFATLGVALLASGCGGGGQSSAPAVPAAGSTQPRPVIGSTKVRLTIKLPVRTSSANATRRKPQYVSLKTNGIAIRTGAPGDDVSNAAWQLFDVSANAPACSTDATSIRTCVITVTAPVIAGGIDEFQMYATDQAPLPTDIGPTGNALSTADTTITVAAGVVNPVTLTPTGVIGLLSTTRPAYSVWAAPGQTATVNVPIVAADYGGGIITGNPPTFANVIEFSDPLGTASPYVYPSAKLNPDPKLDYRGLIPPATPGPILAPILYTAPAAAPAAAPVPVAAPAAAPASAPLAPETMVTVNTNIPTYLGTLPNPPSTTFALDPMVVSVLGTPVGALPLSILAGPTSVTVTETGASSFTVTSTDPTGTYYAVGDASGVPLTGSIVAKDGVATFTLKPVSATGAVTPLPTVVITDANGTAATLNVTVAP